MSSAHTRPRKRSTTPAAHRNGQAARAKRPPATPRQQQASPVLTVLSVLTTLAAVGLYGSFAYRHVSYWSRTGRLTGIILAAQASVLVVLYVCRRRPSVVSRRPADWITATVGTFGLLLLRPGGSTSLGAHDSLYTGLQMVGVSLSVWCVLHLGRSFGVVAANRGVRSSGPYRFVRHPMYASYLLIELGYLLSAWSPANAAVITIVWAAQLLRAFAEERVLLADASYRRYAARVRWRLVPGVF